MVWIHGGAYTIGMSSLPEYDGSRLARDGGVVVVTFNYRVGLEGFGQIEGAPANRGLLDQIAALEWVHDNIRASAATPTASPSSASLRAADRSPRCWRCRARPGSFGRAVAQSVAGHVLLARARRRHRHGLRRRTGARPTAADLASVEPARLSAAGDAIGARMAEWAPRWGQVAYRSIPFSPVVEATPCRSRRGRPWRTAPAATSSSSSATRETNSGCSARSTDDSGQVTEEEAATPWTSSPQARTANADTGRASRPRDRANSIELVNSDWLFRMPTLHLAQAQTTAGGRAHVYELTWPAPGMGGSLGACHGLDVPLVFGNLDRGLPAMLIGEGPNPEAEALSARMRAAWTTFATHGDPGWTRYDAEQRLVQLFDADPTVAAYPEETSRLIWQDHTFDGLPLLGR